MRRIIFFSLVSLLIAAASTSCAALWGIEDTTDDPADGGVLGDGNKIVRDGGGDVVVVPNPDGGPPSDAPSIIPCPGIANRGPTMVRTTAGFCIDSTEVTRAQYTSFMAATVPTAGQAPECASNVSYAPAGWPYSPGSENVPAGVDWCDAVAFCNWAGKRLCGSRADGGVVPIVNGSQANGSDPAISEWASACSQNGARVYPYGAAFQASSCNGAQFDAGKPLAVGTRPNCQGGDNGIFDMSGNVWEWDMTCVLNDAGRPKNCGQRGGGYTDNANLLVCALTNYQVIGLIMDSSGFRRCGK